MLASQEHVHWLELGVSCNVGHKGGGSADEVWSARQPTGLACTADTY